MSVRDDDQSQTDDPRVVAAVQEYMALLEAGRHPSRREFLSRYPDVAGELGACLDGLAFVHSAVGQIAPALEHDEELSATAQPLGDFRLVREIGRGGMGVVYEAVQLSLGRRVALKVLPMASALDRKHLERFHNEAQAAAQLHHTNIVPVYAVGCERSVHYYAMQLIEGQSLADVIGDLRKLTSGDAAAAGAEKGEATIRMDRVTGLPAEPVRAAAAAAAQASSSLPGVMVTSGGLTTLRSRRGTAYARSVAALALQVAEALDYAHRAGVVHRDIKPANLLLDGRGTLWVTDFGLAQVYADRDLTRSGDMIGTLRYMSPEQASGRAVVLDQRTDIYSLGVTLYELLTLERAFNGTTHEQLMYQVAYLEPRPARAIDRTVPRELEVIIGKAMAKEPGERYQTSLALADDLRRFLADEPILARPPTRLDKGIKWVRRHRAWAAAGVAALVLTTVTLTVSNVLIARAKHNTQEAYALEWERAIEADLQRQRAERSWAEARQAVDFFTEIAIGMDRPEFSQTRHAMLEESLAYYQAFMDERRDDPAMADALAGAQGRVSEFLGLFEALDAAVRAETRVRLLRDPAVRQTLKLTAEQATAVQALAETYGFGPWNPGFAPGDQGPATSAPAPATTSPAQRQLRFAARAQEIDAAVTRAIGPDAAERLKQISRQVRGAMAFSDPDVAAKVGLTRAQRTAIHRVQAAARNARRGPGGFAGGGHHGGGPGDETWGGDAQAVADVVKLLTPAQAAAWGQSIGERVDVATLGQQFDGGGGGPGHGHGLGPARD